MVVLGTWNPYRTYWDIIFIKLFYVFHSVLERLG